MNEDHSDLTSALEALHHVRAKLVQTVPVHEEFRGRVVWDGVVHVFDIEGHPEAAVVPVVWTASGENKLRLVSG
jgi:hypothetical protein